MSNDTSTFLLAVSTDKGDQLKPHSMSQASLRRLPVLESTADPYQSHLIGSPLICETIAKGLPELSLLSGSHTKVFYRVSSFM